MDIERDWPAIKMHFRVSWKSNLHVTIASVNNENKPTATPIGSLFLNADAAGFYFEKFPSRLPQDAVHHPDICVLAVNSSSWFWLVSLFKGRFNTYPAIKLYGILGEKRKATPEEKNRLLKRMRRTNRFKGHRYLWQNMDAIREIKFIRAEKINLGTMTSELP